MAKIRKGGGSGHVPHEQPDGLKSKQLLRIIDLIGEGEIEGPKDGLRSVYLDDTPIENDDGTFNFTGIEATWTNGTQDQEPLKGFDGVRNEVPVSVEVKKNTPIVRTIDNPEIDRIRVTVGVTSLYQVHDNGDVTGTKVEMDIQVFIQGQWNTRKRITLNDKTKSQYLTSYMLDDLPPAPFQFRVVRVTEDSESSKLQNATLFSSYTEIIDAKLSYPNTALVGIELDSSQFSSVPRRSYLIKGRRIQIPSNYDPETRLYSGIWDGRFKIGWTNNPAWVYYDLATCKRAGIGERLGEHQIDKWSLYQVAQYCDGLVEDGFGNLEPRMTCNVVLDKQEQAYNTFASLASIFRALPIWNGTELSVSMDAPQDSTAIYTNANVVDGKFTYQSSGVKARHTACHVDYQSPEHGYDKRTEYVADDELIRKYGLNVKKLTAFACTSRSQAVRAGKWLLVTEKFEKQTVSFSVGREGLKHLPGDVIEISDSAMVGARMSGRVKAVDGQRVTLDAAVEIREGEQGYFSYINELGKVEKITIFSQPEPDVLILDDAPVGLVELGVFSVSTANLAPKKFRCLTINEDNDVFKISALEHIAEKHQIVENGLIFEPPNDSLLGGKIPPVENIQVQSTLEDAGTQILITWTVPRLVDGISFEIKLLRGGAVAKRDTVTDLQYQIAGAKVGDYRAEIRAINSIGQVGPSTSIAFKIGPPSEPVNIIFTPTNFSVAARVEVEGVSVVGTEYDWWAADTEAEVKTRSPDHYLGRGFRLDEQGLKPDTARWYGVQAVNSVGRSGLLVRETKTLLKPSDILDLIGPEIPKLDWMDQIIKQVKENTSGLVLLSDKAALVVNKDGRISGITVTAGDKASAVDFLADFVSFTDPDTLERNLYWDNAKKCLVLKGQIQLLDGTTVSGGADIASSGFYRLKTSNGVFPSDTATANSLFESHVGRKPVIDDVFTVYSVTSDGTVSRAESKMYTGSRWDSPKMMIDGNLIATGTIRGDRIVAGSELNAPKIKGGEAGFGGGGPYTGHHTYISSDGTIRTNRLQAVGGKLKNLTIDEDCKILGTLSAKQIQGDFVSAQVKSTPKITRKSRSVSVTWTWKSSPVGLSRTLIINPLVWKLPVGGGGGSGSSSESIYRELKMHMNNKEVFSKTTHTQHGNGIQAGFLELVTPTLAFAIGTTSGSFRITTNTHGSLPSQICLLITANGGDFS